MNTNADQDLNTLDRETVKSKYHVPKLKKYGSIRDLTLTAQKAKTSDNPGKDMNMTG